MFNTFFYFLLITYGSAKKPDDKKVKRMSKFLQVLVEHISTCKQNVKQTSYMYIKQIKVLFFAM